MKEEKFISRQKVYYEKNKADVLKKQKANYEKNKDSILDKRKKYYIENRTTLIKKASSYQKARPQYLRKRDLFRYYKMTIDDYNNMVIKQNGKCAICGKDEIAIKHKLYVDHDHKTGKVRGLLCRKCNCAIGYLLDNTTLLMHAIDYLDF